MRLFGYEIGQKAEPQKNESIGDTSVVPTSGVMKAYIPEFLYKPPFGYPRKDNIPLIRQLAKNPYVYSVVKTLADEAASIPYNIVYKEDVEHSEVLDKIREDILDFLDNPNNNKESFQYILRAVVKDISEVDAGVIIKIFNREGKMVEMFARDGGSILINPDIYGYIGNRAEYVSPVNINYADTMSGEATPDWEQRLHQYELAYKEVAAYFQYGTTAMALPVPFGRRELIYIKANPQSNNVYGLSPIQILADIITTLVYGANYNLDFYMNNNMPEGMIQLTNADKDAVKAFRERFDKQFRVKDEITGFMRKQAFKYPVTNMESKFIPFQLDPKVMQVIEQQEWFSKIVWACFGVTAEEMGFTQDSNKAVAQNQSSVYKRKAVKPMLQNIKYHIDKEIIAEWGEEAFKNLEFKWDDYDLDEDIKKHSLYESQIRIGIKTPEMIAEEEGIDVAELTRQKDEAEEKEMQKMERQQGFNYDFDLENKSLGMKAKYIRRTGGPGNYKYWYKDPITGQTRTGPAPKDKKKPKPKTKEEKYSKEEFEEDNATELINDYVERNPKKFKEYVKEEYANHLSMTGESKKEYPLKEFEEDTSVDLVNDFVERNSKDFNNYVEKEYQNYLEMVAESKTKSLKALGIQKGTRVKISKGSNAHTGKTGIVESVRDNGEENYYIVRFQDGMDIFFYDEMKVVSGGIPEIPVEEVIEEKTSDGTSKPDSMIDDDSEPELKADDKPWNDLEKDLVAAIKSRGKELLARMDMLKNSELDKIK